MSHKISLRTAGIIAGAAAIFAFLFGIIITAGLPSLANKIEARTEASPDKLSVVPLIDESGSSPFARIVELVSPAVVNISAERNISSDRNSQWYFEGPFQDFFRDFFKDFPRIEEKTQTLGSGFIISQDGYVVTNYHVIKNASNIIIKLTNKKEYKGKQVKIIGVDKRTDIALLKIKNDKELPYLNFGNSEDVRVGDWAIAVGNPFHLEGTVTVGVISAKGRANIPLPEGPDLQSFLQTDAAINPGNSGGPLVNIHGEVIGINTAITSPSGGNVGIGFAIPANLAKEVINKLKSEGKVVRGYLGIQLQEITVDLKEALGLPSTSGVLISEVLDDTPASRAGFKSGDVIIEFDGKKVTDLQAFRLQVSSTPVGKKVKTVVYRDGRKKTLNVIIGEYPEEPITALPGQGKQPALGLQVVDLNDYRARQFKITAQYGVLVINVSPDSPADKANIKVGDIILAVNKQKINDIGDYKKITAQLKKNKPVIFMIERSGRKLYIALTP